MTTTINLLPWREERRKQRQHEFFAMLVFAALVAGLIFWLWRGVEQSRIADQQTRNDHIQSQIAKLNKQIREIQHLKQRRQELVARMKVIQALQGNRPSIVYVFDQLVRTLPDGVYYTMVQRKGGVFTIDGVAESNNRISRLMRNMEKSPWFINPSLLNVKALPGNDKANSFELTVQQGSPEDKKKNGADGSGNKGGQS